MASNTARRRRLESIDSSFYLRLDAPLRLHVLGSISDDLEDWEHLVGGVRESTGRPVAKDTIQRELESLIAEGLVQPYALSSGDDRLIPAEVDSARLQDEWAYWFFPTEAGMRIYCDAIGWPFPPRRVTPRKARPS